MLKRKYQTTLRKQKIDKVNMSSLYAFFVAQIYLGLNVGLSNNLKILKCDHIPCQEKLI